MSAYRIRLDPLAVEALDRLERDQLAEGMRASRSDLVSAIVCGTTAAQAVGMSRSFARERARREDGAL